MLTLAKKPVMTAVAYLLVLVSFSLMISALTIVPLEWIGVWVMFFVIGFLEILISFAMFLYLLAKEAEIRRQESTSHVFNREN